MYMKLRNTLAGCMLALLCLLPATGGHAQTAAPQGRPAIARDAAIEKAVAERLGQMTLDEKLGQMIQIEINLIAYTDPAFSIQSLMTKSRSELESILQRFGLEKQYPIGRLTDANGKVKPEAAYQFYNLSQQINDSLGFRLDEEKLRMAFEKYKVSSVLNMLGGIHGADLQTWQRATTQIQEAALKHLGIPCMYGLDQVHALPTPWVARCFPSP